MRTGLRLASAMALVALLVSGIAAPRTAHACSRSSDVDPLDGLNVIVAGRATDVTLVEGERIGQFVIAGVGFEVDRYLLGTGPGRLLLRDPRSASLVRLATGSAELDRIELATVSIDDVVWDGAGGSCGALDSDPRGQYWVVGARRTETGILEIDRFSLFAIGRSAGDPVIGNAIADLETRIEAAGLRPAPAGNAGLGADRSAKHRGVEALVLGLTGLAMVAIRRRVGVRA